MIYYNKNSIICPSIRQCLFAVNCSHCPLILSMRTESSAERMGIMNSIIPIALTGSETEVRLAGANTWIRNDSAGTVYASALPGVVSGKEGVVSIPAGGSAPVYGSGGRVYLLGSGSVICLGSDYSANPFKTAASSGGSDADEVARAAISTHSGNASIHITPQERNIWNSASGELAGHTSDGNIHVTREQKEAIVAYQSDSVNFSALQAVKGSMLVRLQIDTDYDHAMFCRSDDGGVTFVELPLGNAATLEAHPASDFVLRSDFDELTKKVSELASRASAEFHLD